MELKQVVTQLKQVEALISWARKKGPSTQGVLASIHRGEAFTKVFSLFLYIGLGVVAVLILFGWVLSWGSVYYQLERWELVLAFVDQFFWLGIMLIALHMVFIRAGHIRNLPAGDYVALQVAALLLRTLGECIFVVTLGGLGHAILGAPDIGWLSSLSVEAPSSEVEGNLKTGMKIGSMVLSIWWWIAGLFAFVFTYSLAGVIEVFLDIERNTRSKEREKIEDPGVLGRGMEHRPSQYSDHAAASF